MSKINALIRRISLVLLIQTIIWLVFTIISMSQVNTNWDNSDYVHWVSTPDFFFVGNYINVTFVTITAVILFTVLFYYLKQKHNLLAFVGFVFIPIYGLLNIVCYSSQISFVPNLALESIANNNISLAGLFIQANPHSFIGYVNGLAYALLGIPSIIFGLLLYKDEKHFCAVTLSINGIFCLIGVIGYIINNDILSKGVMIGGVAFIVSLVFLIYEFKTEKVLGTCIFKKR